MTSTSRYGPRPAPGLVRPQFEGELVTLFGRPARRARQVRFGQFVQAGVVLQPADDADRLVVEGIERAAVDQAGVNAGVQMAGQVAALADRLAEEPHGPLAAGGVAAPQDRMDEAFAQTVGLVVALGAEAGDDRVVDLLAVVAVPGPALLVAMDLDGERVDVDRAADDLPAGSGGSLVAGHALGQGVAQGPAVRLAGQPIDQTPVRRLAGQTLVEHGRAGAVPDGQLDGRVVGQDVLVVLVDVAEGKAVEVLAEQFDLLVADAVRAAGIGELGGQVGREGKAVVDLANEQDAAVIGDSLIGLTKLDGSVKRGLEEPFLAFTHEVHLPFCSCGSRLPLVYTTERVCASGKLIGLVNNRS